VDLWSGSTDRLTFCRFWQDDCHIKHETCQRVATYPRRRWPGGVGGKSPTIICWIFCNYP